MIWSADNGTCVVKRSRNQFCDCCFASTGPTLWNSLPEQLRQLDITFGQFKRSLNWLIEQGLTAQQTHYRSYQGRVFTGHMTQPTVSKHDRWKRLCLVSWAVVPCVWKLRAPTRNLLTYFLTYMWFPENGKSMENHDIPGVTHCQRTCKISS